MNERLSYLIANFKTEFGYEPTYWAQAPGRVNLIGEHTDYNGCPVLPMALEQNFLAVFAPSKEKTVTVCNTDPGFSSRKFRLEQSLPPYETGNWGNYCKAGVQTILDAFRGSDKTVNDFSGMDACINGTIPPAAGLSSSSALVVISALMFLKANNLSLENRKLAELLAQGERYVGTQGGGMDQAASLLSERGKALKIDFNPFDIRSVSLPEGYSFIVANSLIQAEKTREAMDRYNLRTIECKLGVALLKALFARQYRRAPEIRLLGDLKFAVLGIPEEEIIRFTKASLHESPYGLGEIGELLGKPAGLIAEEFCRRRDGSILPPPQNGFKIRQRVMHVLKEWKRVEDSVSFLEGGEIRAFGTLMNDSHASCKDLFEISCTELDALVRIAGEEGALGSRLTGAGFGGCTVSLVKDGDAGRFIRNVLARYYNDYMKRSDVIKESGTIIFPCKPGSGARSGCISDIAE